jgi:hypothetical protein
MPSLQTANPNTAEVTVAVVPSNTVVQPVPFRALWVGVAGDISVTFVDGSTFVFVSVPNGFFPHGGIRVNATGTTASSIGAVY